MTKLLTILFRSRVKIKIILSTIFLLSSIFLSALLTIAHFPHPMDFGSFLAAGQEALSNGHPYTYTNELVFIVSINEYNLHIPSPNLNPPISIPIFELLALTGVHAVTGAMIWKAISIFWYLAIIYYLIKTNHKSIHPGKILWILALAGFWQTIEAGQIYMPLVTIALLSWNSLKNDKPYMAGLCIGLLVSIKPQFVIWSFFLFLANQKKAFFTSAFTAITISLLPLLIFGKEVYIQWVRAIAQYNGILLPGNTSLQSLTAHLGGASLGNVLGAILLFFVFGFAIIKKIKGMQSSALALPTILLASPYSWSGYTLFLLPLFIYQDEWSWKKKVAAGMMATPFPVILATFAKTQIEFILFGWIYGWAVFLLLIDEMGTIQTTALRMNQ